ncbi:MAG: hypothetical protein L0323_22390 [Planctomycetes bacterium]|nr:hypothetical protein [Planctomycetota bacterium]
MRLLLLAAPLLAGLLPRDVVETKDGRRLEGKVVEESRERIVVETPFGRVEVARENVRSVERGPSPLEEYAARRAKAKTAEDHHALALFCKSKGLSRQAKEELEEAARLDPSHEGANRGLGRVLFEGKWVSPAERDVLAARREEEAFRAKGLVQHEGRWVTPQEKEALEKGLVLHEGRWVPEAEAMAAKGFVRREGSWIPRSLGEALAAVDRAGEATGAALRAFATDHFVAAGPYEETFLKEIGEGAERVLAYFDRLFGAGAGGETLRGQRAELYVFEDAATYGKAAPHFASGTTTVGAAWVEYAKKTNGFVLYEPKPVSVAARLNRERGSLVGHTLHHVGHLLPNRRAPNGRLLPPWYDEGVACLGEFAAIEANTVFCRAPAAESGGGYYRKREAKAAEEPDPNRLAAGKWREELRRAIWAGAVPPLEPVLRREISEITLLEILLSMATVERLAGPGPAGIGRLHARIRRGMPPSPRRTLDPNDSRALHEAAFLEAVGLGIEAVSAEVRRPPPPATASGPTTKPGPSKPRSGRP